MIRKNINNKSSSSEKLFLNQFKFENRRLFIQIHHHSLDQRLLLLQISTSLSRHFKSVFQLNQFKEFLTLIVKLIENNLTELDVSEKYNLQDLNVQCLFLLSPNIDLYCKLMSIFSFEEIKNIYCKESIEMINIIILKF